MTVKELIERLHEFDESLQVFVLDDSNGGEGTEPRVRHANLSEEETYVLLTTRPYADA